MSPTASTSARSKGAWAYPLFGCAAVLICILLSNPFNEMGFNDDWSYGHVAMKLAQTGRMQYNGWGSPILLFQSLWAVPWIRAFGFSFQLLQIAMIPISLGFVLLVYATGRRVGLSPQLSAFAAVTTGTSPLFIPSAASWMTESPGCFFIMLCIYAAVRGIQAAESRTAVRWLWVLALAGVIGGANRQIVWVAPIVLIPYLVWARRADAAFRVPAIAAYGFCAIAILAVLHFLSQPYGPLQLSHKQLESVLIHNSGDAARLMLRLVYVCVFASIPAYCCFLPLIRRRKLAWSVLVLAALAVFTIGAMIFATLRAPYGNSILTESGIASEGQEFLLAKTEVIPFWLRVILSMLGNACLLSSAWWVWKRWKSQPPEHAAVLSLFGVFSLGYFGLILPGALIGFAFDRYMLPILPLLLLALLMPFARHQRRIPAAAWSCLLMFAFYGIAITHDYFAGMRARGAMAHRLERTGIARDRISAGFEYDGWTMLQRSGYVRVVEYSDGLEDNFRKGFWFEFWNHGAGFQPDYVILNGTCSGPVPGGAVKANFHAWTPPFQRSVVAWRRADLTTLLQAATFAGMMR